MSEISNVCKTIRARLDGSKFQQPFPQLNGQSGQRAYRTVPEALEFETFQQNGLRNNQNSSTDSLIPESEKKNQRLGRLQKTTRINTRNSLNSEDVAQSRLLSTHSELDKI